MWLRKPHVHKTGSGSSLNHHSNRKFVALNFLDMISIVSRLYYICSKYILYLECLEFVNMPYICNVHVYVYEYICVCVYISNILLWFIHVNWCGCHSFIFIDYIVPTNWYATTYLNVFLLKGIWFGLCPIFFVCLFL